MAQFMKENSKMMKCMEKVYTNGQMAENMLEIGKIVKWMGKEYLLGQMVSL
jgi:hypothetical protein